MNKLIMGVIYVVNTIVGFFSFFVFFNPPSSVDIVDWLVYGLIFVILGYAAGHVAESRYGGMVEGPLSILEALDLDLDDQRKKAVTIHKSALNASMDLVLGMAVAGWALRYAVLVGVYHFNPPVGVFITVAIFNLITCWIGVKIHKSKAEDKIYDHVYG